MKRPREEDEGKGGRSDGQQAPEVKAEPSNGEEQPAVKQEAEQDEEDLDRPLLANYRMSRAVRKGAECPYLDTISRQVGGGGGDSLWSVQAALPLLCLCCCMHGPCTGTCTASQA